MNSKQIHFSSWRLAEKSGWTSTSGSLSFQIQKLVHTFMTEFDSGTTNYVVWLPIAIYLLLIGIHCSY